MEKPIIVIINPTYNEKENILVLIDRINALREKISHYEIHQLIVDDTSPDGTGDLVRQIQETNSYLHLLEGKKQGLGVAYVRGMQYAMKKLHADFVVQMDADLQHNPDDLPKLIETMEQGYDVVIGSRYIQGGSYPKEWGRFRVINSTIANSLARFIAGLSAIKDCTAGYKIIRVNNTLDRIDFDTLKRQAEGYSFQLMLLAALVNVKAKVTEYPIHFSERTQGKSKVGMNTQYFQDILEFFKNATLIRLYKSQRIIKFLIVGGSGAIVNLVLYRFFYIFVHNLFLSELLAGELSIIWNFIFNNYWTFKGHGKHVGKTFITFNLSAIIGTLIASIIVQLLGHFIDKNPHIWYAAVGIGVGTIYNYFAASKFIWNTKPAEVKNG